MDLEDHVADPVCLCGTRQGRTPPVGLHRLWTQPWASGEETSAQDHQQSTGFSPWQRLHRGPAPQHIVRISKKPEASADCFSLDRCDTVSGCLLTTPFLLSVFSFISSEGVSYMTVCHCSLPVAKAFCFLEDLRWEFTACFNTTDVALAARPYPFLQFGEDRHMFCCDFLHYHG